MVAVIIFSCIKLNLSKPLYSPLSLCSLRYSTSRGFSLCQDVLLNHFRDSVFVVRSYYCIRFLLNSFLGVAHSHSEAGLLDSCQIVEAVAYGNNLGHVNAQQLADFKNA